MEGELWNGIYQTVLGLASGRRRKRQQFSDRVIVLVYLWAVLHDRPVCWACQEQNWPDRCGATLPSPATMSRRSGSPGVVKLMDFGIARSAESGGRVAGEGTVGTPFYMSPEQAKGLPLDARSDLYSVGVVLFEMFVGTRPFDAPSPYDVIRAQISAEPPAPRALRPDLPEALEALILGCLSKDPNRRPPSAADLLGALMRLPV